jgi:transposase-like protein
MDCALDMIDRIRDVRFSDGIYCLHCRGQDVIRWGTQHGRQRYRCQHCGRTFSDTTQTPAAYTKRIELWQEHLVQMGRSSTAGAAAAALGVSAMTIGRWRDRCADALIAAGLHLGPGRIEFWRKWDLLVIADHDGRGISASCPGGQSPRDYISVLRDVVLPGSTLLVNRAFASVARAAVTLSLEHEHLPLGTTMVHAARYARELRGWCRRFRGIGYYQRRRYHTWFHYLSRSGSAERFVVQCLGSWATYHHFAGTAHPP